MNFIPCILWFLYVVVIPVSLCWCVEHHPSWFRFYLCLLWIVGISLLSWGGIPGVILISAYFGLHEIQGPELGVALILGWLYPWIAGFPVFLCYGAIRLVRFLEKKFGSSQTHR